MKTSTKNNPRYKGIYATIDAQRPSDVGEGESLKVTGFSLHPGNLMQLDRIVREGRLASRSQAARMAIAFAATQPEALRSFLIESGVIPG